MPILPATDHDDSQERSRRQILYYSRIGPGQRTMTGRIETEFGVRTRIRLRRSGPGGGMAESATDSARGRFVLQEG